LFIKLLIHILRVPEKCAPSSKIGRNERSPRRTAQKLASILEA
jgi:hypothetical protein